MVGKIVCPVCGKEAEASGTVSCLCDLDFCEGQRCGADRLFAHYKCPIVEVKEFHQRQRLIEKHILKSYPSNEINSRKAECPHAPRQCRFIKQISVFNFPFSIRKLRP